MTNIQKCESCGHYPCSGETDAEYGCTCNLGPVLKSEVRDCGTCKWWEKNDGIARWGWCNIQIPVLPKSLTVSKRPILAKETGCPCWEAQ